MHLFNHLKTPPGLRLCYWHSDYVPECQPFLASKMKEQENRAFFALEDIRALEKHEKNQAEAAGGDKRPPGALADKAEALSIDGQTLRLKTGKREKFTYFLDKNFLPENVPAAGGVYNIHNNAGTPAKMPPLLLKNNINRRDFLAR